MPAEFDACRAAGGKIRTISGPSQQHGLSANEYIHVCIGKGGKTVMGEKKTKVNLKGRNK